MDYITDGRCIVNLNLIASIFVSKQGDRWTIEFYTTTGECVEILYYDTKEERDEVFEKITEMLNAQTI